MLEMCRCALVRRGRNAVAVKTVVSEKYMLGIRNMMSVKEGIVWVAQREEGQRIIKY